MAAFTWYWIIEGGENEKQGGSFSHTVFILASICVNITNVILVREAIHSVFPSGLLRNIGRTSLINDLPVLGLAWDQGLRDLWGEGRKWHYVLFSPPCATYTVWDTQCDDGHISAQPSPSHCAASGLLQDLASQQLQKDDLIDHPPVTSLQTGLVPASWFFSLSIEDTKCGHLKYPSIQQCRTWLQFFQRAPKLCHSMDFSEQSNNGCYVQSKASYTLGCACVIPGSPREMCIEVLCPLEKSRWKIFMYITFLPISSHFSLPIPRALPVCIELGTRDWIIKFKMLNFRC